MLDSSIGRESRRRSRPREFGRSRAGGRSRRPRRQPARSSRRGVLLLVVLSMLVLFMLIGTAFLMSSGQSKKASVAAAKNNRVGNNGTRLLDRALLQVLRDTDNQNSVVRYHSLLRDLYGTNGFQFVATKYTAGPPQDPVDPLTLGQMSRFAEATPAAPLGPTQGQFVDIYFKQLAVDVVTTPADPKLENDPETAENENALTAPNIRNVLKLDRDVAGQLQLQQLPLTRGYYNGCLITATSGAAVGQTARILDYEYLGELAASGKLLARKFRIRAMAFQRADGQPLQVNASRSPELSDLAGATFIVNGRAFGGTGVGYNPLAASGQPRLNALELFATDTAKTEFVGAELALLPNSVYFNPLGNLVGAAAPGVNPLGATPMPKASLAILNDPTLVTPFYNYPTFVGPGDANEPYDAADFQNMFLALQTVTPRAQGRVVESDGSNPPKTLSAVDPALNPANFLRLDLEDVPLPSFHRPDLINFWYHRLLSRLEAINGPSDDNVRAILQPYDANGNPQYGLSAPDAALITAIKRQSSLRPLREDNPNFNGSNPMSVPQGLDTLTGIQSGGNIKIPFWEAVGPWDVDNDNDGVADSVWVDLGDPVQEAEDGTRYKALYAYLIIDLDSRLNVNAHGLADQIVSPLDDVTRNSKFDPTYGTRGWPVAGGNLVHSASNPNALGSTLQLPRGIGYGPAEISLRPVFPVPLINPDTQPPANRAESAGPIDDYATVLFGRQKLDGTAVQGKYGFDVELSYPGLSTNVNKRHASAGANYQYAQWRPNWLDDPATLPNTPMWFTGEDAQPSVLGQMKFFNYPWSSIQSSRNQSAFGTAPDLKGRYALGLDFNGQPVYEVANDVNPNQPTQPFNLLAKSPYELDLSGSQRRDGWASSTKSTLTGVPFANPGEAFVQSLGQNDDSPFSPTDLEKVLRAWDADAGTLPSRLWDNVNAFDPVKLMNVTYGDPNRVSGAASAAFGSVNNPELLASAQQIAGINRRLVTTEGYSLPVANQPLPAWVRESALRYVPTAGPTPEEVFRNLTGVEFSKATLINLLAYRFQTQRLEKFGPYSATNLGGAYNTSIAPERALLETQVGQITQQILAPEIVAGQKMDVNRPFGDGRDGNSNSVVDEPLEAGEPFLDINGNGKRDDGTAIGTPPVATPVEPFINLDGSVLGGNPSYTPPSDQLWADLTVSGKLGEQVSFDYTNGVAVPVHKDVFTSLPTPPIVGGVRNLESQGRQQYARQLYCLMLLLVDEHYVAPWDENDPQIMTWMEAKRKLIETALLAAPYSLSAANAKAQSDFIVKRKNTCRMIAQWAINCVDMRDSDVIMTPFEYDENPWDGWGCTDRDGNLIPIDGDPSTDENGDVTKNEARVLDWKTIGTNGGTRVTMNVHAPASVVDQTRGLIWGDERPELLITETLAFHDRRTEDLPGVSDGDHDELNGTNPKKYVDNDMDQRLRPRGSLYVELYNPWSSEGQYPAELYSKLDVASSYAPKTVAQKEGVELGRLSNLADDNGVLSNQPTDASSGATGIKRSPVWRMIVVEDWPEARNRDPEDEKRLDVKRKTPKPPAGYTSMLAAMTAWKPTDLTPPPYHAPDPDFSEAFDASFLPKKVAGQLNQFEIEYPYIEREFYFTTDKSPKVVSADPTLAAEYNYSPKVFRLRIPNRSIQVGGLADPRAQTQKFIPPGLELSSATEPVIAPIMPGRYGVIGSPGAKYSTLPNAFTTTIGREDSGEKNTKDLQHKNALMKTRRIVIVPDKDPDKPQITVASNGGDPKDELHAGTPATFDPTTVEIGRDNELINNKGTIANITDMNNDGLPDTTAGFYRPSVAIPIDGMNISEPPWGWAPREAEAAEQENALNGTNGAPSYPFILTNAEGEGSYGVKGTSKSLYSYDKPFDTAGELVRTGSTANYRSIHLQRLANPLLPWNPAPFLANGTTANPEYKSNLPINPYLTVDTASVNLTAFNGPSEQEHVMAPAGTSNKLKKARPWVPGSDEIKSYLDHVEDGTQAWYFRSSERGAWARLNMAGQAATPVTSPPQRVLWAQEPAMIDFRKKPNMVTENQILDLIPGRNMTMRADEISPYAETNLNVSKKNHVNMVLKHTLGFGNESFGLLYDAQNSQGAKSTPPFAAAVGAPAPGNYTWNSDGDVTPDNPIAVNSTNPWLEWGNRPYVSAEELLNVPGASQSTMLRMYSTIDPSASSTTPTAANAFGLGKLGTKTTPTPVTNADRWRVFNGTFGQLPNMFASSALYYQPVPGVITYVPGVSDVVRDTTTGFPVPDAKGNVQAYGAPNFYRILDYVQVPSRYVGTDTMLNAETFNDVTGVVDGSTGTFGTDITNPDDPRYKFQPPFNKVSRERDPARVNLNTVSGRRNVEGGIPRIWSEVFDGIMHRTHDANPSASQLGQGGPAWRDVELSRRGYAQVDAAGNSVDNPPASINPNHYPDTFSMGLNNNFPTVFANPFRSSEASDLVPLQQMVQFGVDTTLLRKHPYDRATDTAGARRKWGPSPAVLNFGDARDAGYGANEAVSVNLPASLAIPNGDAATRDTLPLFSELRSDSFADTDRNPYMMYQPMTRLGNLVTDRSGAFAIWITVGYFEVEPAPDWATDEKGVQARFGGDINLYNRAYPDGYMLGRELGSDTGDTKRARGFYIIDRTEEVGFKPGEDLNVEKLIRLRRRIE